MDNRLLEIKGMKRAMQSYVFLLYETVLESKPDLMLEIGTMKGQSTKAILLAMLDIDHGKLISVDHKNRDYLFTNYGDYTDLKPRWEQVRGNSHEEKTLEAVKKYGKFDLLLIDGDHTYKGVKQDFEWYAPLVKAGGLIFMHDITNRNTGVKDYWKKITWPKISLGYGKAGNDVVPGMGIVQKGCKPKVITDISQIS